MDAIVQQEKRLIPALANAIKEWFPELREQAFPVADATITKENIPPLPIVMVALVRSVADPPANSKPKTFDIMDRVVVEFWLQPERYKRPDDSESPFWSYYPYEEIRNTLLSNVAYWDAPGGVLLRYREMHITVDPLAVTLSFFFDATIRWCATQSDFGQPFHIGFTLCTPKACIPDPCAKEAEECPDPCP